MWLTSERVKVAASAARAERDFGAEVLRFLARHGLPATPPNYEIGYAAVATPRSLTARAIDSIVLSGAALDQDAADRITSALRKERPAEDGEDRDRARLRLEALRFSEAAADVRLHASDFGRTLEDTRKGLSQDGCDLTVAISAMIEKSTHAERELSKAAATIEALRREIEVARGDAASDALTGLLNRRGIIGEVKRLAVDTMHCVAICDIDHFKRVNDRYGHVVGDRVLRLVAESLQESCASAVVGRWGGEEFAIVMAATGLSEAVALIERALADLARRNVRLRATDEPLGRISFSAGVSTFAPKEWDAAVERADTLLYRAKEAGRCCVIGGDAV